MGTFRTRIRAVRFKSGGEVRLLRSKREDISQWLVNELKIEANRITDYHLDKVAGFALVIWTADGDIGSALRNGETSQVPRSVLPSLVADAVRRLETVTQINNAFGHDDETA